MASGTFKDLPGEQKNSLFHDLLKQKLVDNLKIELMDVAEREVDKIVARASEDFEVNVRSFLSHEMENMGYKEMIYYGVEFKKEKKK